MTLILAIEPDRAQAALLAALSPRYVDAEILPVPTVDRALEVLATRVPDLLLTPMLLSARDDAALTARVRELNDRGIAVPILVIPVLAAEVRVAEPPERPGGLFTRMRKARAVVEPPKGCSPEVFADQIVEYLTRAAAERHDREETARSAWSEPPATATAPLLAELLPPATTDSEPGFSRTPQAAADQPVTEEDVPVSEPVGGEEVVSAASTEADEMLEAASIEEIDEMPEATATEVDESGELWTPLPIHGVQLMPALEGPSVRASSPRPIARIGKAERGPQGAAVPAGRTRRARKAEKPMQDEWGLYDPEQCGFAALLERLDQLAQTPQADEKTEGGSAIMRQ